MNLNSQPLDFYLQMVSMREIKERSKNVACSEKSPHRRARIHESTTTPSTALEVQMPSMGIHWLRFVQKSQAIHNIISCFTKIDTTTPCCVCFPDPPLGNTTVESFPEPARLFWICRQLIDKNVQPVALCLKCRGNLRVQQTPDNTWQY